MFLKNFILYEPHVLNIIQSVANIPGGAQWVALLVATKVEKPSCKRGATARDIAGSKANL